MALKKDWDELEKGDWYFINDDTYIAVQYGDDRFLETCVLPINKTTGRASWNWNNSKESPTLRPSIAVYGNGRNNPPTWHGYLTDGKLTIA
ncbi:MAG TPA: hypothetical protein DC057_02430 [Spirochaetia bacterium]|nr:hypothetical protein [Spirochaetia bacterium]